MKKTNAQKKRRSGEPEIIAHPEISPPKKREPVSPMKIFAGFRLNAKNPKAPPARVAAARVKLILSVFRAMKRKKTPITPETDEASPSIPSVKFAQ